MYKRQGKNSSICKFYLGNNFDTLTLKQFKEAINHISEKLSIDIRKARVCRIDISTNFSMVHTPSFYHSCLKDLSRFQKVDYSGNIYFKTRKVELNFYDKKKEYKQKGVPIPDEFKDSENLLRYEIRFKKSVAKTFGKIVTIKDLCDEKFFLSIVQKWRDKYWNITKKNPIIFQSPDSTFKTSDFKNYYMLKGMESTGGFEVIYSTIESSKKTGAIGKDRAYYLKKATRKIYESKVAKSQFSYDFINELDEKMRLFKPQIE